MALDGHGQACSGMTKEAIEAHIYINIYLSIYLPIYLYMYVSIYLVQNEIIGFVHL